MRGSEPNPVEWNALSCPAAFEPGHNRDGTSSFYAEDANDALYSTFTALTGGVGGSNHVNPER